MALPKLTYEDFKQRLSIQEVLQDAGYRLNRRDGMRYPSYVRVGADGRRVGGDKFIVSGNGTCCFQPPERKNYNIISFIKEHPYFFADYKPGMSLDRLVNVVCHRLLNVPMEEREAKVFKPERDRPPFTLMDYEISSDRKHIARFLIPRGIDKATQEAFEPWMRIATKKREDGKRYGNIAFPLRKPDNLKAIVGLEVRGFPNKEGKTTYKGMAAGSNSSEGMWMAIPNKPELPPLDKVQGVAWFESAYDAMAFYQIHRKDFKEHPDLCENVLFISTGGTPTDGQMRGLLQATPEAHHFLGFDNDKAGREFCAHFHRMADSLGIPHENVKDFPLIPCYKDWNDALLGKTNYTGEEVVPLEPKSKTDKTEEYTEQVEEDVGQKGGMRR